MNIKQLGKKILCFPSNLRGYLYFALKRVYVGKGIHIKGSMYIRNLGRFRVGDDVYIISSGKGNPIGGGERGYFQVLPDGELEIGNGSALSNCAITCANEIRIGGNVFIGAGVKIYDTDFHSINPYIRSSEDDRFHVRTSPIIIEDSVFIGAESIILKGVKIGRMSVIGAGSVVTSSIPEKEIWAGNPAKFIRKLRDEELKQPSK